MKRHKTELVLPRTRDVPPKVMKVVRERLEDALKAEDARESYRAKALRELARYQSRERAKIVGSHARKLKAFRAAARKSREQYGVWSPRQSDFHRREFLRYAGELGVNVDGIFRLHAYCRKRAALLMTIPSTSYVPLLPDPPGDSFDENVESYEPPYSFGHFSTSGTALEGDAQLKTSTSFLDDATAVTGGAVRIRNWDADNDDYSLAYQENGFLACYRTKNAPGLVKVTAAFQWVESQTDLSTEDEWGWSDCTIYIDSWARFAVYLSDVGDLGFTSVPLQWWHYAGDGEDPTEPEGLGWGTHIFRVWFPGGTPTVSSLSANVLPANSYVGIYVGTRHQVEFFLNDVSADGTSRGKLLLTGLTVAQT